MINSDNMAMILGSQDTIVSPERRVKRSRTNTVATQTEAMEAGGGTVVAIPRSIPMAYNDKFTVQLKYVDQYLMNATQTTVASQTWAVNDLYDPDFTGVGHQPYQRDNWVSMYNFYSVLNCHVKLTVMNGSHANHTSTASGTANFRIPVQCTIKQGINSSAFVTSTPFPRYEMKYEQVRSLMPEDQTVYELDLSPGDFQMDNADADNDRTWTAVGASPSVRKLLNLTVGPGYAYAIAGLTPAQYHSVFVLAELTYTVQFNETNATIRGSSS